ncbi:LnmK family bifunctional acyltransferase/decarboxylase [Streptomyces sp. NPDC019224]|uniref:LnmK family bifunctional acyltransferase/decarboxylase n=1 Tax=Streptomyces sp. NPDC019224 TaxID=3154484 RepID=UPI0033E1EC20
MTETLITAPGAPAQVRHFARTERTGPATVRREVTVQPGMCGPNALLIGRIGDWTWETVSEICGTDVFNARDPQGRATYLSFYYYRVRSGGRLLHPRAISFGDRLEVISRVFGYGSESVLTLHRIRRIGSGPGSHDAEVFAEDSFEPEEFYERPRPDCLYVENFNRWVARGRADSNVGLVRASPADFHHTQLPRLPDAYSPRLACNGARSRHRFLDPLTAGYVPLGEEFTTEHRVDVSSDVNGVGLLYFASYFAIADGALLQLWRSLGRSDRSFLDRTLADSRVCYLGNADVDSTLRLRARPWHRSGDPTEELVELVVEDLATDRTLAVCSFEIRREEERRAHAA